MRLFVAFEIPPEVKRRIAERVDALRSTLPPASWVPADRLHLTLDFLGEVEESRLDAIREALTPVFAEVPALRMRLGGPGTFPPGRPARVAWIAIEPDAVLGAIELRARGALERVLAQPLEDRPYHAHVTVARPRRPWMRSAVAAFRLGLAGVDGEWQAPRAVLVQSRLGPDGARYEVRQEYAIAGKAHGGEPA